MALATCPHNDVLRDFRLGKLPADEAGDVADHLDACPSCQASIETISDSADTLVHSLRQPPATEFQDEPDLRRALAAVQALATQLPLPPGEGRGEGAHLPLPPGEGRGEGGMPTPSREIHPQVDVAALGALRDYQLLEELGAGGMGTVYKARHQRLKRIVALKVLPADRTRDKRAVARFEREMEAVGKLEHANIVRALDAGEHEGTHYLVMEYVDGLDLSHVVRRLSLPLPTVRNALRGVPGEGGLPSPLTSPPARVSRIKIPDACELVRQAALGLQCAYEHGLVHRDIKPSNLMLTSTGQVKVLDLGLALLLAEQPVGEELTGTSQMMGTADYCAPEQGGDSHTVDIRADIYSLGCTLYKLLCGHAPFASEYYNTTMKKLMAHMTLPVPPICHERAEIPEGLSHVLDRLLSKNPADRYSTPSEVVTALAPFAAGSDLQQLYAEATRPVGITVSPSAPTAETTPYLSSGLTGTHPQRTGDGSVGNALRGVPGEGGQYLPLPPGEGRGEGILLPLPPGEGRGEGGLHRTTASHSSAPDATTETYAGRRRPRRGLLIAAAAAALVLIAGIVIIVRNKEGKVVSKTEISDDVTVTVEDGSGKKLATTAPPVKPPKPMTQDEPKPPPSDDAPLATAFDRLQRSHISPYELSVAALGDDRPAPKELVAIFGDSRMKHWDAVHSVALTPDEKTVISCSRDCTVTLWDAATKQQRRCWSFSGPVDTAALSPDGRTLAVGVGDSPVYIYDMQTEQLSRKLTGPAGSVLAWSPDGSLLASASGGSNGTVDLWDPFAGEHLNHLGNHSSHVQTLAFDPTGTTLASGSYDGSVKIWDLATKTERLTFAFATTVCGLAFDSEGRLWGTSVDPPVVNVYDAANGNLIAKTANGRSPWHYAIVPTLVGDRVAVGGWNVDIFDRKTGKLRQSLDNSAAFDRFVAASNDGKTLAVGCDNGAVRLWGAASGDDDFQLIASVRALQATALSSDGTMIASASLDGSVIVWDVAGGLPGPTFGAHGETVRAIAYSADGRTIATGHSGPGPYVVRVWNAATGELLHELQGHGNSIEALAFSSDGETLVSGSQDGTVRLWDGRTGRERRRLDGYEHNISAVAISPDGRWVAGGYATTIKLWDAATGAEQRTLSGHADWIRSLGFSPDGATLVSAGSYNDGTLKIWDISTGEEVRALKGNVRTAMYASFSPDGKTIASASGDGKVRLWDPDPPRGKSALKQTIEIGPPGGLVRQVRYTPDGRHLVTLNGNGTIYALRLEEAPPAALTASER
jgi:WD40 repeat protein/serine/threonine protein kinase